MRQAWRRHLPRAVVRGVLLALLSALCGVAALSAQRAVPEGSGDPLTHIELLKPSPGKITVYLFEDLECPTCARFYPFVQDAVRLHHVPLISYDYPLPNHPWAFQAALVARYLHDAADPDVAEQFRRDLFTAQWKISSREDLSQFTQEWLSSHKLHMPDALDPTGRLAKSIKADIDLGNRIGLTRTPTLIVVGPTGWIQVTNPKSLAGLLEALQSEKIPSATSHEHHKQTSRLTGDTQIWRAAQ